MNFGEDVGINVIANVIAAFIVALLSIIFTPLRYVVLYRSYEFILHYDREFGDCTWDIKWPKFLLSIEVPNVRDDYMTDVKIKVNAGNLAEDFKALAVSDKYTTLEAYPVRIRIKNIVRTHAPNVVSPKSVFLLPIKRYDIYLVVQRRRFFN